MNVTSESTSSSTTALAGPAVVCARCDGLGHPQADRRSAEYLARTHDQLHHGGALTATVTPGTAGGVR